MNHYLIAFNTILALSFSLHHTLASIFHLNVLTKLINMFTLLFL